MPGMLKEKILSINARQSQRFNELIQARREWREKRKTEFLFTLCMDGRINIYTLTGLFFGLFNILRNIGGVYRIGWDLFQTTLEGWGLFCHTKYKTPVVVVTFHWSEEHPRGGCAGHGYDKDLSIRETAKLRDDIMRVYAGRIFSIMIGIETDSEAMIVYGEKGNIDMRRYAHDASEEMLLALLMAYFPNMARHILEDLVPILIGNAKHIMELRAAPRKPHERLHCERVLAIGTGFDWLDEPNFALIIGPCDPDRRSAVEKAANIIDENWKSGRIEETQEGVLLVSVACRDSGLMSAAEARAEATARSALQILDGIEHMRGRLIPLVGVTDMGNRRFTPIKFSYP